MSDLAGVRRHIAQLRKDLLKAETPRARHKMQMRIGEWLRLLPEDEQREILEEIAEKQSSRTRTRLGVSNE